MDPRDDPHQIKRDQLVKGKTYYMPLPHSTSGPARVAKVRLAQRRGRPGKHAEYIFAAVDSKVEIHDVFNAIGNHFYLDIRADGEVLCKGFGDWGTRLFDNYWLAYGWMIRNASRDTQRFIAGFTHL